MDPSPDPSAYPTCMYKRDLGAKLPGPRSYPECRCEYAAQPKDLRWVSLGFLPLYTSKGVFLGTALVGVRLRIYMAMLTASAHSQLGRLLCIKRHLAVSSMVRIFLSTTPLYQCSYGGEGSLLIVII